ncbi:MAG: SH3 domain-containing protein [Oscillochloris sp.]|nr:SH3 domain-containing protein [Oscillochloris sp.]
MFRYGSQALIRAGLIIISTTLVALGLSGCGNLAAALPTSPSPFPTMARLPSVTPVTPSPPPSATPARTPTVTPAAPSVQVMVEANVRSGPGLDFAVIAVLPTGSSITLQRREGEWYLIQSVDGAQGWMSGQILDLPADIAAQVAQTAP